MRQVWAGGVADDMCHKRRRKVVDDEEVNWHEERFSGFPPKRLKAIVVSSRNCFGVESSSGSGRNSSHSTTDEEEADWTRLPDDTMLKVFTLLNHRDRASLASVCRGWRTLAASASLWTSLDIRAHVLDSDMTAALSSRCAKLQRLRFRGGAAATAIVGLQARGLRDLSGDSCGDLSDASLCMMVARHEALESLQLQLGVDCERITNDAIKVVATCCPKLKRLRISGIRDVDAPTIGALAKHCPDLMDLAFFDCTNVDEVALVAATSLRFLSVAGSRVISWSLAAEMWPKLPHLTGLDVSRTDITAVTAAELMAAPKLKVFCAVNCSHLEHGRDAVESFLNPSVLVTQCTDFKKELASLSSINAGRSPKCKKLTDSLVCKDCHLELTDWTECVLSHALLKTAESNSGLDVFWLNRGTALMLNLLQSQQEEVQERAATALATFVVIDDETESVDPARAEAVLHAGGITHLLRLAKSCREAVQSEAAKAIANLSVNADVAKTVAMEGGISILASLARSPNRRVAEEAAGGLWNLSVGEDHKGAIAGAGAIEALVDLAFKWPSGNEGVLERAAGALANLAADDKCSMEVASAGGVHALVNLARFCHHEGVQEQAARALANLAAHGDSNGNNAAVGKEPGALEALVHLTSSNHEGVRQEAAGALWNLSFDDRNREAIAAVGGVEALVTLAQSCRTGSQGLQERAAGALWGLSVSEVNSIAIGRGGGVAPLIALARSEFEDVHETAAGALWNLAFNPSNALLIVEEEGVPALVHLCSSSQSKMARFMAALALAYMFDGRTDEVAFGPMFSESPGLGVDGLEAARHLAIRNIDACVLSFSNHQALLVPTTSLPPAALTEVAESARIQEAGHLRCSGAEVGRFVAMLRNKAAVLRSCAAFALLQFTMPGGRHAMHHISLLQNAGAGRVLRTIAASATAPLQAKVFARVVLRNVELHPAGEHTTLS